MSANCCPHEVPLQKWYTSVKDDINDRWIYTRLLRRCPCHIWSKLHQPGSEVRRKQRSSKSVSDLDLASSRNRIVIHPNKHIIKSKSIFPSQSIFKKEQASNSLIVENTSHSVAQPVAVEEKSTPTAPRLRNSDWEAKKVAQVRRALGRIDQKHIKERPSPRVVNSGFVPPVIPIPRSEFQSPYLEEYAKCGCTKLGGNPCRRCQLMLLSDRQVEYQRCQCSCCWHVSKKVLCSCRSAMQEMECTRMIPSSTIYIS